MLRKDMLVTSVVAGLIVLVAQRLLFNGDKG